MFHGWAHVPGEFAVHGPAGAFVRFDVFDRPCAGWCEGGAVEVEGTMELGVGGEFGVDPGRAKEVEGDRGLVKQLVPQVDRKMGIGGTETRNEVVFEGSDGALCSVATVDTWWGELKIDVVFREKFLE